MKPKLNKESRVGAMNIEIPVGIIISSFEYLWNSNGRVIKFSDDNGKTWQYGKLSGASTYPGAPHTPSMISVNIEISHQGEHAARTFAPHTFKDYLFKTTTQEEIKGKVFSYSPPKIEL